ncbi:nucleotide disphospho-sugar-binding domain-containing protein [Actinomadura gamaensis]|uniref:Nucleotide disphospho-sugar-binding domain-containing protein n=1 Tax=Actinomadura gamaensis TaxID=1763541 RepID=A0ABV9U2W6_9ACTN
MRVLFVTWSVSGHFKPLVPMAWALRCAGHEVLVASHPSFMGTVTEAGLPGLPVGPEVDIRAEIRANITAGSRRAETDAERAARQQRSRALRPMVASAAAMAGDLLDHARRWRPDLVVYEPLGFAGPLVARALGVPAVRHIWATDFTAGMPGIEREHLGELFERYGVSSIGAVGDLTLDPCPPSLQIDDELPRRAVRCVPYTGPAVLPAWLRDRPRRRRVCVTWGNSAVEVGPADTFLAPRVVAGLGGLDAEVVVAANAAQRDRFTDVPANVAHIGPVPLGLLLPTCDAVIHPAGGGTVMAAVLAGLPQLTIPFMPDTSLNARRVAEAGAGLNIWAEELTAGAVAARSVADAATRLLDDPAFGASAARLRDEALAMPTPAEAVPVLERLAAGAPAAPDRGARAGAGSAGAR